MHGGSNRAGIGTSSFADKLKQNAFPSNLKVTYSGTSGRPSNDTSIGTGMDMHRYITTTIQLWPIP